MLHFVLGGSVQATGTSEDPWGSALSSSASSIPSPKSTASRLQTKGIEQPGDADTYTHT